MWIYEYIHTRKDESCLSSGTNPSNLVGTRILELYKEHSIGRSSKCTFCFKDDKSLSRQHLSFKMIEKNDMHNMTNNCKDDALIKQEYALVVHNMGKKTRLITGHDTGVNMTTNTDSSDIHRDGNKLFKDIDSKDIITIDPPNSTTKYGFELGNDTFIEFTFSPTVWLITNTDTSRKIHQYIEALNNVGVFAVSDIPIKFKPDLMIITKTPSDYDPDIKNNTNIHSYYLNYLYALTNRINIVDETFVKKFLDITQFNPLQLSSLINQCKILTYDSKLDAAIDKLQTMTFNFGNNALKRYVEKYIPAMKQDTTSINYSGKLVNISTLQDIKEIVECILINDFSAIITMQDQDTTINRTDNDNKRKRRRPIEKLENMMLRENYKEEKEVESVVAMNETIHINGTNNTNTRGNSSVENKRKKKKVLQGIDDMVIFNGNLDSSDNNGVTDRNRNGVSSIKNNDKNNMINVKNNRITKRITSTNKSKVIPLKRHNSFSISEQQEQKEQKPINNYDITQSKNVIPPNDLNSRKKEYILNNNNTDKGKRSNELSAKRMKSVIDEVKSKEIDKITQSTTYATVDEAELTEEAITNFAAMAIVVAPAKNIMRKTTNSPAFKKQNHASPQKRKNFKKFVKVWPKKSDDEPPSNQAASIVKNKAYLITRNFIPLKNYDRNSRTHIPDSDDEFLENGNASSNFSGNIVIEKENFIESANYNNHINHDDDNNNNNKENGLFVTEPQESSQDLEYFNSQDENKFSFTLQRNITTVRNPDVLSRTPTPTVLPAYTHCYRNRTSNELILESENKNCVDGSINGENGIKDHKVRRIAKKREYHKYEDDDDDDDEPSFKFKSKS
ncbi:uncharacterized protein SCODWIG_03039 [Saccharomycodes ludwigii]|uniref:FHA domain-containing protein n=1 Tax=Saccharomycodes ludwigii TaxID=36035 RepID=A0A376B9B0_9ASCO|nr:uncharacterized protein SCODWIG_03039 [Saccharomycodes ludwigii]